jgi:hypothetical protein
MAIAKLEDIFENIGIEKDTNGSSSDIVRVFKQGFNNKLSNKSEKVNQAAYMFQKMVVDKYKQQNPNDNRLQKVKKIHTLSITDPVADKAILNVLQQGFSTNGIAMIVTPDGTKIDKKSKSNTTRDKVYVEKLFPYLSNVILKSKGTEEEPLAFRYDLIVNNPGDYGFDIGTMLLAVTIKNKDGEKDEFSGKNYIIAIPSQQNLAKDVYNSAIATAIKNKNNKLYAASAQKVIDFLSMHQFGMSYPRLLNEDKNKGYESMNDIMNHAQKMKRHGTLRFEYSNGNTLFPVQLTKDVRGNYMLQTFRDNTYKVPETVKVDGSIVDEILNGQRTFGNVYTLFKYLISNDPYYMTNTFNL